MSDFIELPIKNIIKESQTTSPGLCDRKYVVYLDKRNRGRKIRVNTCYIQNGGKIKLNRYYDRGLCDTIEEYEKLELRYIEGEAYGSYMDGAR